MRPITARSCTPPCTPSCARPGPASRRTRKRAWSPRWMRRWTRRTCARRSPPGGAPVCAGSPTGWPGRSATGGSGPGWPHRLGEGRHWLVPRHAPFTLTGRADRIERRFDGAHRHPGLQDGHAALRPRRRGRPGAATAAGGRHGRGRRVRAGAGGARVRADLLAPDRRLRARRGHIPVPRRCRRIDATVATAREKLAALVAAFDDPDQPYLSQPHPGQAPRFSDYTQLARVAEWAALEEGE